MADSLPGMDFSAKHRHAAFSIAERAFPIKVKQSTYDVLRSERQSLQHIYKLDLIDWASDISLGIPFCLECVEDCTVDPLSIGLRYPSGSRVCKAMHSESLISGT